MSLEEKYKEYTNKELIEVIVKADDYQLKAVEIAKKMLHDRDISNEEKDELFQVVGNEKQLEKELEEKQLEIEKQRIQYVKKLLNKINPFDKTEPISLKLVNIIFVVYSYVLLEQLFYSYTFLIILLEPPISFGIIFFTILFEVFYLLLTLYLYFKRKKIGWIMLVAWICNYVISYITLIAFNLSLPDAPEVEDSLLALFVYVPDYTRLFLVLAFYLIGLIILLKKGVRQVFSVSKLNLLLAIVIGVMVSVSIYLIVPYIA